MGFQGVYSPGLRSWVELVMTDGKHVQLFYNADVSHANPWVLSNFKCKEHYLISLLQFVEVCTSPLVQSMLL
jgi:hypothetical protein